MPIVRSRSPVAKSRSDKEDSAGTSTTDWSMETPATTDTETTEASAGTTASRRTVAVSSAAANAALEPAASHSGRRTRAASAAATVVAAPPPRPAGATVKEPNAALTRTSKQAMTTPASVSLASASAHATELGRSEPVFAHPASVSAKLTPASVTASAAESAATQRTKKNLKNIGGRPNAPPCASSGTVIQKKPERSTRSSRRTELEALRELQQKQLDAAQAAAALAQTNLELAEYASEEELDEEYEVERSTNVEQWVQQTNTYFENPEPIENEPTQKSEIKELAEAIMNATRSVRPSMTVSPKIWDLPEFSGSHEEWLPFKRAYEDSAAMCTTVHNMARLRKAVTGAAKEAIRGLLFVTSDPQDIIAALERRFGRPEQLVLAELQKIKELPRVGDTPREICIFASRVGNAVTTITALKKPHYLYSPEISRSITEKLSPILRYRWLDYSARIGDEEPELLKMKKFLEVEADLCGKIAPPELVVKKRYQVHATHEEEDYESSTVAVTSEGFKKFCAHCEGEHWITECKKFRDASNNERWEIAVKKKLCFKCLRKRHARQNCRSQPCRKCKRPHHIMLHTEETYRTPTAQAEKPAAAPQPAKEGSEVKPVFTATDGKKTYLKMVPVDIYGPKGSTRILALLDEGSTVSLIDKSVIDRIGATGKREALTLETVGGKIIEKKNSQKMDLKIKGAKRRDRRTLQGVRTIEELKLSPQAVSKSTIEGCSHLKEIIDELIYENESPTLLIGQDNWDLIVSRKILKGKRNEPVASLTSLGWVLHGSSTGSAAAPVNYVNHCRQTENEEAIGELIKRHFDLDSIGVQQRHPSNDADGRALGLLEKTTKQLPNGRYESGLLWKKEDEKLPNNYAQAYNRLLGVEKRLDKDAALKEEYGKQLQKLLDSGYAEEAPADSTPDRTFYLPHFSVVHPVKKKIKKPYARIQNPEIRKWLPLEPEHLKKAEKALVKQTQRRSFQKEIENLKRSKPLDNSSRLKKIDVILDEDEILRLNSRAMNIRNFGSQNLRLPIIDGKDRVPQLLIEHYHRHLHHGNHATVINEIRQKFWILSLRNAVKKVSHHCQWCRVRRSRPEVPPLGNLPQERLAHHQPPFTCTGVDYFGPMHVTIGRRKEKRWGALFTCLTTRAIHLELAASLDTSSMIMALRRMAARRGTPRTIYSDNGTNFVGADNELKREIAKMPQEIVEAARREGINWKFIPPGAPNMGGAWERMVRSVKTALAAVLGERSPPEEVLHTLLTEVEHTVNSRPLTHLAADPREGEESLTPNHFLIGRSCGMTVLGNFDDTDLIRKPNWKTAQRLADHFWNRWLREYLPTLMPRKINGQERIAFEKGDVVIIADHTFPRNTWPRGVIEETFPGPDKRTRIVSVRTRGGLLKRPTSRLILLASGKTLQPKDGVPNDTSRTGGENC